MGYSLSPCLRTPHTKARESSQDHSDGPGRGLGDHSVFSSWVPQRQQGHSSLSHLTRTQREQSSAGQALTSLGNWTELARDRRQRLCCSKTRRNNLSARANVQLSGRMPAREPGERKLSDEEPGKAPRLNSTVGRTKMEMVNAKMSGISFLQRNNLY